MLPLRPANPKQQSLLPPHKDPTSEVRFGGEDDADDGYQEFKEEEHRLDCLREAEEEIARLGQQPEEKPPRNVATAANLDNYFPPEEGVAGDAYGVELVEGEDPEMEVEEPAFLLPTEDATASIQEQLVFHEDMSLKERMAYYQQQVQELAAMVQHAKPRTHLHTPVPVAAVQATATARLQRRLEDAQILPAESREAVRKLQTDDSFPAPGISSFGQALPDDEGDDDDDVTS